MVFHFRTPSFFDDCPVAQDADVLRKFSFKELKTATRNFSRDNLFGIGASGEVFKGRLQDGSLVAVKRMREGWTVGAEERFQREMEVKSLKIQHPNILSLKGYCTTKEEYLLVYPLMIKNSLGFNLRPSRPSGIQPLGWAVRKRIALGVARGLAYLHHYCDPKIIHRDISTSNILLDQEFEAVIGDFNLARIMHQKDLIHGTIECPVFNDIDTEDDIYNQPTLTGGAPWKYYLYDDTYVPTAVHGNTGYSAPEYMCTGKCTLKSDVFAFGNLLLNLITGETSFFKCNEGEFIKLIDWVRGRMPDKFEQLMDPDLQGHYVNQEAKQLVELAFQCAHNDPRERPEMLEVVRVLEDLGETPRPRLPILNSLPMATLSRSESDSTLFYSFSSAATSEVAPEWSADL